MNNNQLAEKLWKQREERGEVTGETEFADAVDYIVGAVDVLALDLPVKFAEWEQDSTFTKSIENGKWYDVKGIPVGEKKYFTTKELYQYWLDNVFKIE